jgi:serine/threonine protein kinase
MSSAPQSPSQPQRNSSFSNENSKEQTFLEGYQPSLEDLNRTLPLHSVPSSPTRQEVKPSSLNTPFSLETEALQTNSGALTFIEHYSHPTNASSSEETRIQNQEGIPEVVPALKFTEHLSEENLRKRSRFQFLGKLGSGGMAVVFEAIDLNLKRRVAVKVAHPFLRESNQDIERFLTEAQVTSQLEHPNIVPVHEFGTDLKGRMFFTMKKVQGVPLSKIIEDLRTGKGQSEFYTPNELLRSFRKICDAVAFAHSHQVIHRDLKPENIMFGKFGEILVMDWGLAKVLTPPSKEEELPVPASPLLASSSKTVYTTRQEQGQMSLPGAISGTPAYMSPEQARGENEKIKETSDIYALGAILFEIFALVPPVTGKSLQQLLHHVSSGYILKMEELNPKVPKELAFIIHKCLRLEPADRYQTVEVLSRDIDAFLDHLPISCYQGTWVFRLKKYIQRHSYVAFVVALIAFFLVLLSTVLLYFMLQQRGQEREKKEKLEQRNRAHQYFIDAVELTRRKEPETAILKQLQFALKEDPSFYLALFEIAVYYQKHFQSEEAIRYFLEAQKSYQAEKQEVDLKSLFNVAMISVYQQKNIQKAKNYLKEMTDLSESSLSERNQAYYYLAKAYQELFEGNYAQAYTCVAKAEKINTMLWEVHSTLADICSVGTAEQQEFCFLNSFVTEKTRQEGQNHSKERNEAWYNTPLMCWNKAIMLNPEHARAYLQRGEVYDALAKNAQHEKNQNLQKSYLKLAENDYEQAFQYQHPVAVTRLFYNFLTQQKFKEAEELLQKMPQLSWFQSEFSQLPSFQTDLQNAKKNATPYFYEIHLPKPPTEGSFPSPLTLETNLPEETLTTYQWRDSKGKKISKGTDYSFVQEKTLTVPLPPEFPPDLATLEISLSLQKQQQNSKVLQEFQNLGYSWEHFEANPPHYRKKIQVPLK